MSEAVHNNRRPRFDAQRRFWMEIRRLRRFRIADLILVGGTNDSAKMFVRRLRQNGIVVATSTPPDPKHHGFPPAHYELVKDLGQRCPRFTSNGAIDAIPTAQERLWAAMKPLRQGFSVSEIASLARVTLDNAKTYVSALRDTGYLEQLTTAAPHRFRLKRTMNTGPEPPLRVPEGVWDINTNTLVPFVTEEVPA